MNNQTQIISGSNASIAWAKLFLSLMDGSIRSGAVVLEIHPAESAELEDSKIRSIVDVELKKRDKFSIRTTAALIFPYEFWEQRGKPSLQVLSDAYLQQIYPRLVARSHQLNSKGTYFQRMIKFTGLKESKKNGSEQKSVNQLQRILDIWQAAAKKGKHPRHSALQATIFDPAKDHHGAALCVFPCLQQVSFSYHGDKLTVNAYYPNQYIFDRAYGNYLGLCNLGRFMAENMGLRFDGLVCFIGQCQLGNDVTKTGLSKLKETVAAHIEDLTRHENGNLLTRGQK